MMTDDERRAEARRLIAEAFRERPTIDVTPTAKFIAGRDVAADVSAQANGEKQDELRVEKPVFLAASNVG